MAITVSQSGTQVYDPHRWFNKPLKTFLVKVDPFARRLLLPATRDEPMDAVSTLG